LVKQSLTNVIDGFEILMSRPLGQPICSRREIGWSTTMGAVMIATPVQELKALNVFIGSWLTEGETVPNDGDPAAQIVASGPTMACAGGHR